MSLYDIIGVSKTATTSEIRKAYYARAKELHPDKNPGNEAAFVEVSNAFSILSDESKRAVYDRTGSMEEDKPQQQAHQQRMDPRDLFSFVFSQFFAAATASGQSEGSFFIPFSSMEKSFFAQQRQQARKPFGQKVSRYLDKERNVYVIQTTRVESDGSMSVETHEEPGPRPEKEVVVPQMQARIESDFVAKQSVRPAPAPATARQEPEFSMEAFTKVFTDFLKAEDLPLDRDYETEDLEDCGIDELAIAALAECLSDVWPSRGARLSKFQGGSLVKLFNYLR